MLGESLNNQFYDTLTPALRDTLDHALYHAPHVALHNALTPALYRTLRHALDAALVQLQKDLKNVR